MAKTAPRDRKFVTLFDGDEIDGKTYPLDAGVTGLDGPTAEFLIRSGRIAEVDDETFAGLKSAGEPDSQADADADDDADDDEDEFATAAADDFAAGRIPDDLVNPDATGDDKLIARAKLDEIAKGEGVETKSSMDKADVARAIMAARAKVDTAG